MAQLKSLGYLGGASRTYSLSGQGADPKDRLPVLRLMEAAELRNSGFSPRRRIEALGYRTGLGDGNNVIWRKR